MHLLIKWGIDDNDVKTTIYNNKENAIKKMNKEYEELVKSITYSEDENIEERYIDNDEAFVETDTGEKAVWMITEPNIGD